MAVGRATMLWWTVAAFHQSWAPWWWPDINEGQTGKGCVCVCVNRSQQTAVEVATWVPWNHLQFALGGHPHFPQLVANSLDKLCRGHEVGGGLHQLPGKVLSSGGDKALGPFLQVSLGTTEWRLATTWDLYACIIEMGKYLIIYSNHYHQLIISSQCSSVIIFIKRWSCFIIE